MRSSRKSGNSLNAHGDSIDTLLDTLATRLLAQNRTMATAESCTGGLVASWITARPGSSHWFECGFVTYSNASKQQLLKVRPQTLADYGAVSEQTVREMAEGALQQSAAVASLAISGIAGPGGGTADKPVGTVCFGWALCVPGEPAESRIETWAETRHFSGDRQAVRQQAARRALAQLAEIV